MSHYFGYISKKNILSEKQKLNIIKNIPDFEPKKEEMFEQGALFFFQRTLLNQRSFINNPTIHIDDDFIILASCRLYNKSELLKIVDLAENSHDFEFLLKLYLKFGENCVKYLIGDFSFVIVDKNQRKAFLAKDQLGIRPLFYYSDEDCFIFSTSIPAIKATFETALELNKEYIAIALKNALCPVELTFYEKIYRLKPASTISVLMDELSIEKHSPYWELEAIDISNFKTQDELYQELELRLTQAVCCRAETDRNIGCQLSGGMDSSAIAVLLSRNANKQKLHTFSFVLNEHTRTYSTYGVDEQKTQADVIAYAGLIQENHHQIDSFHYKDTFEQLEQSNCIMGGYADSDSIWQDSLFREAQKYNVGVSFSGFPGDEGISTHGNYFYYDYLGNLEWMNIAKFLKEFKLRGIKRILEYYFPLIFLKTAKEWQKLGKIRNLLDDNHAYYYNFNTKIQSVKSFKEYLKTQVTRSHTTFRTESEGAYALHYGIETVYPMADIRLLQLVYSLPTDMFKPKPYTRALFRNLSKNMLPDSVRLQAKFSGALTLAFAEFWIKKQIQELENTKIVDRFSMYKQRDFNLENFEEQLLALKLKLIDIFIEKNL